MAFAVVDSWQGGGSVIAPVAAAAPAAWPRPDWAVRLGGVGNDSIASRSLALTAACIVGLSVIAAVAGFLDRAAVIRAVSDRLPLAMMLERPVAAEQASGGAARRVINPAVAIRPPSPIDTSTPTPVSRREWSVTRIPQVGPDRRAGEAGADGGIASGRSGSGTGLGGGGAGVYDPYAGASPQRRASPLSADGIDRAVLDGAIAEVRRRHPGAYGRVSMRVRLSPTGMVLDVTFDSRITPALADTIRRVLIGRRLAVLEGGMGGRVEERDLPEIDLG